ncbi:class I SAM-dependent methyltransferase [Chloroflexus sp.]|uniref:class I SAM-dependent methyltransferase n=1 Tax=Chloroflexus sp. TaxID=1904827 RepID=UPI0026080916|nr:class I SAM-dependent methyltransferase [uncultured Chloroflexus sp.]
MPDPITEQNRRSWNAVVPAHISHRADEAAFLRNGGSTLFPEEIALLGEIRGCRLLHLLCNTGADSLSLAARGAVVTGVDLSDAAIAYARALSAASGIPATFAQADVYEYLAAARADGYRFERIYAGYGVICWLRDLRAFAAGVAGLLAPGGRFVLIEFHPASNMFTADWRLAYDYPRGGNRLELPGVGDYVGAAAGGLSPSGFLPGVREFTNPEPCTLYRWGIGEVVTALAQAELRLRELHEYCYVNGERPFERMTPAPGRRMLPPPDVPAIPLMYGLAVEKDGDDE